MIRWRFRCWCVTVWSAIRTHSGSGRLNVNATSLSFSAFERSIEIDEDPSKMKVSYWYRRRCERTYGYVYQ